MNDYKKMVSDVLWNIWDPIGVNAIPEALGEYDSYVSGVVHLLQTGATEDDLVAHLLSIEIDRMGLAGGYSTRPAAKALLALTR